VSLATPIKVEQLRKTLHATAKRTSLHRGSRVPKRDSLSESRMREICTSGLMSGRWKRSMAGLVRHRQTKEPVTDRPRLNHRATSRLYPFLMIIADDAVVDASCININVSSPLK
jgi:hypothetical protein